MQLRDRLWGDEVLDLSGDALAAFSFLDFFEARWRKLIGDAVGLLFRTASFWEPYFLPHDFVSLRVRIAPNVARTAILWHRKGELA